MERDINPVAQKLLEVFRQFHKVNWKRSPIEGMKPSEIQIIFSIKRLAEPDSPGIKVSEISTFLKISTPTVTQLINGLVERGFVERTADQEDRRAVRVKLTESGEGAMAKAHGAFIKSFNGLVEYLGEEQSRELTNLLSKVFIYFSEIRK